jgi:hypothetical protein
VAELADALDSGSSSRKGVKVQVLSSAPIKPQMTQKRIGHPAMGGQPYTTAVY